MMTPHIRQLWWTICRLVGNNCENLILWIAFFEISQTFHPQHFRLVTFTRACVPQRCQSRFMLLLCYFSLSLSLPASGYFLTPKALHEANKRVTDLATEAKEAGLVPKWPKTSQYTYSAEDCAHSGKYAVEHGPAKAVCHFSLLLKHPVTESTAHFHWEWLGNRKLPFCYELQYITTAKSSGYTVGNITIA